MPALGGNGLAMRAGATLEALAERYRISLLVLPIYAPLDAQLPVELQRLCHRVLVVPPGRPGAPAPRPFETASHAWTPNAEFRFDVVHVFRLVMLPFARLFLNAAAERRLDLDDVESISHRRLAALHRLNGDHAKAESLELQARRYEALELAACSEFDRIYVCSECDRKALAGDGHSELYVLANAVRLPPEAPPRAGGETSTLLFVGTLGHYPNEDAIVYFATQVLPLIRRESGRELEVHAVGAGASGRLHELAPAVGVELAGARPDLDSWYAKANVVILPIRAGGGTRIKLLEAFSYKRPVVSTSIGAEGIDALHGEHLLLADTPEAFAQCCVRLMSDREMADRLVENAYSLLLRSYTIEAMKRSVSSHPLLRLESPQAGAPLSPR